MSLHLSAPALDRLTAVGGYFALHPEVPDDGQRWRPVTDLLTDAPALAAAITCVAARLGTTDRIVAASVLQQGWASRLTSIYAGTITLGLPLPDLAAPNLRYHQPATGPIDLALAGTARTAATATAATTATAPAPAPTLDPVTAWQRTTAEHLRPFHQALRRQVRLAHRQLWGNAAASFAGSLRALARAGHAELRWLVRQPWADPPELRHLGRWIDTPDGLRFHRTTCCGLERLPHRGPCAGCPFAPGSRTVDPTSCSTS